MGARTRVQTLLAPRVCLLSEMSQKPLWSSLLMLSQFLDFISILNHQLIPSSHDPTDYRLSLYPMPLSPFVILEPLCHHWGNGVKGAEKEAYLL